MKKILLLCSALLLCFCASYSQNLTSATTTITSGGTVTVTGSGESNSPTGVYWAAEQGQSILSVTPSSYFTDVTLSFNSASYYISNGLKPTTFGFVITSTATVAVTVKFEVLVLPYDEATLSTGAQQTFDFTVTVNPKAPDFTNTAQSGPWYTQGCSTGYTGTTIAYTVPAGYYNASTQAAANALAYAAGQAYINAHTSCVPVVYNTQQGPYYNQTCSTGYYGTAYYVAAGLYGAASQAAANSLAQAAGQSLANSNGPCTVLPAPVITNVTASGTVLTATFSYGNLPYATNAVELQAVDNLTGQVTGGTNGPGTSSSLNLVAGHTYTLTIIIFDSQHNSSDNTSAPYVFTMPGTLIPPTTYYNAQESGTFVTSCGAGYQGTAVVFTVPANTPAYNSPISQADANSKALAYINGGAGQAYANANGSCTIVTGIPTFTESYGGHGGLLTFAVTPNIPNPGTSVLYWTDTTTGQTGSSAGAPGGFTSTFTDGHTYQFYFVCYGSGTPSSGTSATQTYYMP